MTTFANASVIGSTGLLDYNLVQTKEIYKKIAMNALINISGYVRKSRRRHSQATYG